MARTRGFLRLTHHGWWILLPTLLLCGIGLATIFAIEQSATRAAAQASLGKQLLYMVAGIALMLVTLRINYERLGRYAYLIYGICFALLLVLVLDRWINLPGVPLIRGSRRWIRLPGFQMQPSELMKIGFILALAWYLRFRKNYRTLPGLIGPFLLTLVPMALIKMQPDLGMMLIMLPVLFAMLFVAGARIRHLAVIVLLALACMPFFWMKMELYQRVRVTAMLLQSPTIRQWIQQHPDTWLCLGPKAARTNPALAQQWQLEATEWKVRHGYQLVRSKAALGSGGITGQGWGRGTFVQYDFLPDMHNDFIFAIIGHEFGLLGCIFVIGCYAVIVLAGFETATLTNDPFGKLLAIGVTVMIATQVFINVGMTVGLAPITGLTLPFVSYGGSSILTSFLMIGLLISVAQRRPMRIAHEPFIFKEEQEEEIAYATST